MSAIPVVTQKFVQLSKVIYAADSSCQHLNWFWDEFNEALDVSYGDASYTLVAIDFMIETIQAMLEDFRSSVERKFLSALEVVLVEASKEVSFVDLEN